MKGTVKVRFLEDHKVKDEEGREFKAGQVYDLRPDSARHFTSRQLAVEVDETDKPAKAKAEAAAVEPPESAAMESPRRKAAGGKSTS